MKVTERNISLDFMRERTKKDTIIVHFTAGGTLAGAEAQLAKPDTINVHYIMDKSGQLYQYFPEMYWAHHCGNTSWSKRSISLEIVNWGGLKCTASGLWLPWTARTENAVKPEDVFHCDLWRGYTAFELLTPAQEKALPVFLDWVASRHPIENLMTHADVVGYKTDFPPAFSQVYDAFKYFRIGADPKKIETAKETANDLVNDPKKLQERINWLIIHRGWNDPELKELIRKRDRG